MSNTHKPPQHNTGEATNNSNTTTLLENIYANIDAGLTFDAASEIIKTAKNKMFIFFCSVHRLSVVFRIRIAYSNSTGQPGCNTKNNFTVESRIQNRIVL